MGESLMGLSEDTCFFLFVDAHDVDARRAARAGMKPRFSFPAGTRDSANQSEFAHTAKDRAARP
ncbi:hypothetical protein DB347_08800 [Opitutaceae bacterium EW11]|nr:hypothetical protein DB347_08800 [Opitutaceae bacterium EW11]